MIRLKLFAILFLAKDYVVVDIILVTLQFQIQANLDLRNINTSRLDAPSRFYGLVMKETLNVHLLLPFKKY